MQAAFGKTGIGDDEVGKRYDVAIAKIAELEKTTPLHIAARVNRDEFFQECNKIGKDPSKMLMAYYAKHLDDTRKQREKQQQSEQSEEATPMDVQNKARKKTEVQSNRKETFLDNKPSNEFRVRIGDMKRERNRQKKLKAARSRGPSNVDPSDDAEADMQDWMDEGIELLKELATE